MVTVIVLVLVVQNHRPDALLVYETKFSNVLYAKNLAFFLPKNVNPNNFSAKILLQLILTVL